MKYRAVLNIRVEEEGKKYQGTEGEKDGERREERERGRERRSERERERGGKCTYRCSAPAIEQELYNLLA